MYKNIKYKEPLLYTSWLLAFLFLMGGAMQAQQYKWAANNGTISPVTANSAMSVRSNGNVTIVSTAPGTGTRMYSVGAGDNTTWTQVTGEVAFDANLDDHQKRDGIGNSVVLDPVDINVRYISQIIASSSTLTTSGFAGWAINFTNTSALGIGVAKQTWDGTFWVTNWTRFVAMPNTTSSGISEYYSIDLVNIGGIRKVLINFRSRFPTSEEIGVYSNGGLTNVITDCNNPTHLIIKSSNTTINNSFICGIAQFDGTNGTPEFLGTIADYAGSYKNAEIRTKYEPSGKMIVLPIFRAGGTASLSYKNYTNNTGAPASTYSLGSFINSADRYALMKIETNTGATAGNVIDAYTTNLNDSSGNKTNFVPINIETDVDHAYIIGHSSVNSNLTYNAQGTAGSVTTNGTDVILVKASHNAAVMQPVAVAKYGATGIDFISNSASQIALDRVNGKLYFNMKINNAFTQGGATVLVNPGVGAGGSTIMQINTSNLTAANAINILGNSPNAAVNTNSIQTIKALGVNPTNGDLYLVGDINNSALLKVNNTTVKTINYFNGVSAPVANSSDCFVVKLDHTLATITPSGTTFANVFARSSNEVMSVTKNATNNIIYAGNFFGEYTTPAGTIQTSMTKTGFLLEVDPTDGTILKAIQSTDNNQGFYILKVLRNTYDDFLYVLSVPVFKNWGNRTIEPIGNNAPTLTINSDTGMGIGYVTKIDPANFNHVWTSIIAQNNSIAYSNSRSELSVSDLDFDPLTGAIFVVGHFGSKELLVSTQAATTAATFTTGNGIAASSNYSFVASNVAPGVNEGFNSNFMVKIDPSGAFQFGATFGTINAGMNNTNSSKVSFLNNKLYVIVRPSSANPFHFNVQGSTGAGTSIFTTVAHKTYLLALDAATPALPTATRDFSSFNLDGRCIVSDKLNNRLYIGHRFIGSLSLSGTSQTSSGGWDSIIHEIGENTMADVNTGNIKIGGNGDDVLNEIKVDDLGKLFYIGTTSSSSFNIATPGGTVTTTPSSGGADYLVGSVDIDSLYKPIFAFVSGSTMTELANSISPGALGSIFVGGDLKGQATFGTQTIFGNPSGDLLFGRIDYPYKGPGGINSGLDNWFDAKYEVTQSGANVTMIENKNKLTPPDVNPNFPSVTNTGTIPYNVPTATEVRANFAPSFTTSTGNVLENTGITSNLFANQGKSTTIFMVAKPTDATSELMNWTETTNNSRVNINASNTVFTNAAAGTKTTTNTAVVPANKWSLVTMNVTPAGAITNGLNGKTNGTNTGAGVLNTTNAGTFTIGGGASTDIAEMATYSNSYVLNSNQFGQIASYFCLKYGVTLDNSLPYRNSRGSIQYDHTTTGSEFNFRYDVAGLARDDYAFLDKRQTVSANSNLITFGAGNQIQIDNASNTAALSDREFLLFGSDTAANAIGGSKIASIPPSFAICEGFNLEKTWRVKVSLPYAQRSADLKKTKVTIKLSEAGMVITKNAIPSSASSYYLMIDRNDNGVYSDTVDQAYAGTTLTQVGGVDEFVTFENVEFDKDSSGSDQFTIVWRSNGGNAAVYAPVGTSGNLNNPCINSGFRYYRDPADQEKSYAIFNPNGNTFVDTAIKVTRAANTLLSDLYQSPTTVNRKAAMMPYFISVVDANNYTLNGGVTVRFFYDPADKDAVDALYTANNSWVHYAGTAAAFQTDFTTTPNCYTFLTPVSSGLTVNGLAFVDLKIPTGGTIGYLAYEDRPGLTSCKIIYGTDPNAQIAGTQLFAHDNVLTFQLNNTTGGVATVSGLTPPSAAGYIDYDIVGKKWYVWDGTNWYPVDNDTNRNPGPTTNGTAEGKIIFYQGHVWGWDGTSWKQLDNQ